MHHPTPHRPPSMRRRSLSLLPFLLPLLASCGGGMDNAPGGTTYRPFVALGELTASDASGEFRDFALVGTTLYIAAYVDGVRIIDIRDLTKPTQIGQITPFPTPFSPADRVIAVAANAQTLVTSAYPDCTRFCPAIPYSELRVYDAVDPKDPKFLARVPDVAASALLLEEKLLYVLDAVLDGPSTTLRVFDLASPGTPRQLASIGVANAASVVKKGNLLYLGFANPSGSSPGVQVVDVSNPSGPTVVSIAGAPSAAPGRSVLAAGQSGLYAVSGAAEIRAYPQYATGSSVVVPLPRVATGLSVTGQRLFATQDQDGVAVFDLAGSATPARANTVDTGGKCTSVATFAQMGLARVAKVTSASGNVTDKERLVFFSIPG